MDSDFLKDKSNKVRRDRFFMIPRTPAILSGHKSGYPRSLR